nr:hypothetical protein [Clostridia bacterium]
MASVTMTYTVQSCPNCNKRLLKVAAGSYLIGSPLITCKKCGKTYRTDLRVEWYRYPTKWTLWAIPLIMAVGILIVGALMGEPAIGIMGAIFGLLFGLCFTIKDVVRMIRSKRRMKEPEYLAKLLLYGAVSIDEYEQFMQQAKQ